MIFSPHKYQETSIRWLIQRTILDGHSGAALFQDPGLGKTVQTLAWLRLLRKLGIAGKALIVAPLRVAHSVWPSEVKKWDQFSEFTVSRSLMESRFRSVTYDNSGRERDEKGNFLPLSDEEKHERARTRFLTLQDRLDDIEPSADIHLINTDGVDLLSHLYSKRVFPWDVLIVDESSAFKTWGSDRSKSLRKLVPRFKKTLILTGTPSPNGLEDLYSQIWLVDRGESLGKNITTHRKRYFHRGGFEGYKWLANENAGKLIETAIAPLALRMSAADNLDLPELLINDVWVDLPAKAKKQYKQMEREMFLELDNGDELAPVNSGAKYQACKQMASGSVYEPEDETEDPTPRRDRKTIHIHDAGFQALEDIVSELQGKPVLVAYNYNHQLAAIQKRFPKASVINGRTSGENTERIVDLWNRGEIHVLAVQTQALSHGVNMQSGPGRDIVWLGLPDIPETYIQLNARIYRQGVSSNVRVHRILSRSTVDEAVRIRLETKNENQNNLLDALNEYRKRRVLETFAKDIRDGYDCDEDAHKYGTPCRCCEASKLLDPPEAESSDARSSSLL